MGSRRIVRKSGLFHEVFQPRKTGNIRDSNSDITDAESSRMLRHVDW